MHNIRVYFGQEQIQLSFNEIHIQFQYSPFWVSDFHKALNWFDTCYISNLFDKSSDKQAILQYRDSEIIVSLSTEFNYNDVNIKRVISEYDTLLWKELLIPYINLFIENNFNFHNITGECRSLIKKLISKHSQKNDKLPSYMKEKTFHNIDEDNIIILMIVKLTPEQRVWFISDMMKFSYNKFIYIVAMLGRNEGVQIRPTYSSIVVNGGIVNFCINVWEKYTAICNITSRFIDIYPFTDVCLIPSFKTTPKTITQWALCREYVKDFIGTFEMDTMYKRLHDHLSKQDDLESSYIQHLMNIFATAPDSIFEYFTNKLTQAQLQISRINNNIFTLSYLDGLQFDLEDNASHDKLDTFRYRKDALHLVTYLTDAMQMYRDNKDYSRVDGNGRLRTYKVIASSLKKMIEAAIDNHILDAYRLANINELEKKKLNSIKMAPPSIPLGIKLGKALIKTQGRMIRLGKKCNHCIGSKINSTNIFFNKSTICAEVSINQSNGKIIQCYDANNKVTIKSKKFEEWLVEQFNDIGIKLIPKNVNPDDFFNNFIEPIAAPIIEPIVEPMIEAIINPIVAPVVEQINPQFIDNAVNYMQLITAYGDDINRNPTNIASNILHRNPHMGTYSSRLHNHNNYNKLVFIEKDDKMPHLSMQMESISIATTPSLLSVNKNKDGNIIFYDKIKEIAVIVTSKNISTTMEFDVALVSYREVIKPSTDSNSIQQISFDVSLEGKLEVLDKIKVNHIKDEMQERITHEV